MSSSALATDLYQLTMIAGYDTAGVDATAAGVLSDIVELALHH